MHWAGLSLTFLRADCVEVTSGEAASESTVESLVTTLLIFNRLLVHRYRLSDGFIWNTRTPWIYVEKCALSTPAFFIKTFTAPTYQRLANSHKWQHHCTHLQYLLPEALKEFHKSRNPRRYLRQTPCLQQETLRWPRELLRCLIRESIALLIRIFLMNQLNRFTGLNSCGFTCLTESVLTGQLTDIDINDS